MLVSDLLRFLVSWLLTGVPYECFVGVSDAFRLVVGSRSLTPASRLTHVADTHAILDKVAPSWPKGECCILLHELPCLAGDSVEFAGAWNRWMYPFEK
jgi:hypothetical protein